MQLTRGSITMMLGKQADGDDNDDDEYNYRDNSGAQHNINNGRARYYRLLAGY